MRRITAQALLIITIGVGGCSTNADLGDATNEGIGGKGGGSSDGGNNCASGIVCGGSADCCAAGQECIKGACVASCASGTHCGSSCCNAGQGCLNDTCVTPTSDCEDSVDCAASEYCELALGKCLPQPPTSACAIQPDTGPLTPTLKWSFTTPTAQPESNRAISAPLVVDVLVNGEHQPAVFLTTGSLSGGGTAAAVGYLRRLRGKDGGEAWGAEVDALKPENMIEVTFAPAVADLDGDKLVDVVAMASNGQLVAFDGNGMLKWRSTRADGSPYVFAITWMSPTNPMGSSTIAIADMDHNGNGESVLGGVVFAANGVLISGDGRDMAGGVGSVVSSIVADVDGDGILDVVLGNAAYRMDGNAIWSNATDPDGYPAIADLDLDGKPELVVATGADLRVLDAKTGQLRASLGLPLPGPGSPVIADFAGNGTPEIALQMSCAIAVFHFDGSSLKQNWSVPLTQCSGQLTATAFDFNGDGSVEVLAHDDCRVAVLDGATGAQKLSLAASHATWTEFVSVADVDGNGRADMLFSTNDTWGGDPALGKDIAGVCKYTGDEQMSHGLFVYSDPQERWMPTRKVWNQQSYHITNIKSDGTLPAGELDSWGPGGWNNYRVSAQGKGVTTAPDLIVSLGASLTACPTSLKLVAIVQNQGTAGVPANLKLDFFQGSPPGGTAIGSAATTKPLLPGASETVTLDVPAPAQPSSYYATIDPNDVSPECVESNNTSTLDGATCELIP